MSDLNALVGDVYVALLGEGFGGFVENDELRSEPGSDTIDVQVRGQWYRMSFERIDEPRPPVHLEDLT